GVPETGLSGASGDELDFEMQLPAGASDLSFNMSGGSGDADLYVRFGAAPTTSSYDCRPYSSGNNESCDFASPQEGTYYVMVRGYSSFSGVDLVGSYTDGAPNEAPTASFTFNCTDLNCTFDASGSSDSDGSIVSYSWNFGDGNSASGANPSHSFAADGTYSVSLTVTDNGGATGSDSQDVTVTDSGAGVTIDLSVTADSKRRWDTARLSWSGATTTSVDIYRNGSRITTTANDGAHNDRMRSTSGSFTYQVCNQGSTSDCSDPVTVTF
ncbi:MAG: pre-peptidase C-terminal domain-containing protein, partial [Gammaproteobacteria bacterium]|nr:pre-peptidase C-terminal domain-containing protein [Gammaproteobacteria bacterium]